jgi:hypothetical protein
MRKNGYIVRLVVSFGLMGCGVIVGYTGYIAELPILLLVSYPVFGIGSGLMVWEESRRLDEGITHQE